MVDRRFVLLPLVALLSAPSALAQAAPDAPPAIRDIGKCRAIPAAEARLACFDAAASRLDAAVEKKELTILDREGVKQTKRSLFGFSLPRIGLFGGKDENEPPEFTEINTTIKRVVDQGYGNYVLVLEDGAQWRTTEPLRRSPRIGDAVTIKKGLLGSYLINVRGLRGAKGLRIG